MISFKKTLMVLLALLSAASAWAYETIPADPTVRTGVLPNGLTYYVKQNNYPEHHADFFIAQRVGSVQEEESQRGLAHFLEHMCFNGTKHFPGNSVITWLESVGVKFGANLNAYTSTDETVYNICNVPTQRQSVLDSCLLILSDWSHDLLLKTADIDAERGVIQGEYRMRQVAANRMLEKAAPTLYSGSIYGSRMPIGLMSVVQNFKPKVLRDYYKKWYHPSNQCIIVVGDINPDWAVEQIKSRFSGIKNPKDNAMPVPQLIPDNEQLIADVQTDPEQQNVLLRMFFKHGDLTDVEMATTKFMENDYLNSVVTMMLNSRFADLALQPGAPFTRAMAADRDFLMAKTRQALMLVATGKQGQADSCTRVLAREINRAVRFGFCPSELKRARLKYEASLDKLYRSRNQYSNTNYARDFVRAYLDGEPIASIETYRDLMLKVIGSVTLQKVNEHLCSLVDMSGRNVVISAFLPSASATSESLAQAFNTGKDDPVSAHVDSLGSKQLLLSQPKPGKIVGEKNLPEFGAKVLTLSNGVQVFVKKTDIDPNQVVIAGAADGGLSQNYTPALASSLKALNGVMAASGFGQFTSSELSKTLAGKNVRLRTFVSKTEQGFQGSTTPGDLVTEFQLLYLKLTSPQKDTLAFANFLETNRQRLANKNSDPKFEFADSIFDCVFAKHPLGAEQLKPEEVDQVNYDSILRVYKDRLGDVSGMRMFVVGNFNEDSLRTLLKTYVASLPASGRKEQARDIGYRLFKGESVHRWSRKMQNPQDKVYFFWTGTAPFNDRTKLLATVTGRILSAKFLKEIREDRGWTYHVDSHCSISPDMNGQDAPAIFFPLNVTVTAGKAEATRQLVQQIMQDVATKGIADADLADVKSYLSKVYGENLQDNSYWMVMMKNYAKWSIDFHNHYLSALSSISKQDVQQFVAQLLNQHNCLQLVMTAE